MSQSLGRLLEQHEPPAPLAEIDSCCDSYCHSTPAAGSPDESSSSCCSPVDPLHSIHQLESCAPEAPQAVLHLQFQHLSYWLKPQPGGFKQRLRQLTGYGQSVQAPCSCSSKQRQQHISSISHASQLGQHHVDVQEHYPQQQQKNGKQLLCNVSGSASAGRLLAVMGPSGAGKTTLLSALAGESDLLTSGQVAGHVLLNGRERQLTHYRRISTHVRQEDALLATTTPREALTFAAALRLPSPTFTQQQRAAAVDDLLLGMRLLRCADTLVGDVIGGVKGLSGGERRRLSVAVELLGQPQLAFLDEPSSGQDSSTAEQVITFVKQTILGPFDTSSHSSSRSPGILIITLHQPGREITSLLDDLLLLAPGGRVTYQGPWTSALHYFEQHLQLRPPVHTGLAEWYLSLLDEQPPEQPGAKTAVTAVHGGSHASSKAARDTVHDTDSAKEFGQLTKQPSGFPTLADAWQAFTAACDDNSGDVADSSSGQQQWLRLLQEYSMQDKTCSSVAQQLVVRVVAADEDEQALSQASTPNKGMMAPFQPAVICSSGHASSSSSSTSCITSSPQTMRQQEAPLLLNRHPSAGFWVQVSTLAGRNLRFWWRSPAMVMSEAAQYLFVVLFLGSVYPRMSLHGQSAVVDRLAVLFMWVTALLVTAPSRALICWDMERRLLRRELAAGSYSFTAFLVGTKLLTSLPLETCLVTLAGTLLYFMLGLQATAAKYGAWLLLSVLCAVSASNVGNMIGLLTPDLNLALPVLAVIATMLLAFAGFMVSNVPVWWAWLHEVSFASYAYAGIVRNEFEGLQFQLPSSEAAKAATEAMGSNSMVAAAQEALHRAVAAAQGSGANLTSMFTAAASSSIAVDGLAVVPGTIKVQKASLGGFIGYMAVFAVGTTVMCIACTALLVRVRIR